MANGATVIRAGNGFAEAMQAAAGNAIQFLIARQNQRQEQQRIDISRQSQEFAQDFNMLSLVSGIAENTPGRTLRDFGPGVEAIVRRRLGPEAEVFLDAPVSPKTVKDAMEAEILALKQTDPERFRMITEHAGVKELTGQAGGLAGLEASDVIAKAQSGKIAEWKAAADAGDPEALRLWHQASRLAVGLDVEYIDPMSGARFDSTAHANTALAFLNAHNAALEAAMGGGDGREMLLEWAKAARDDLKDSELDMRISLPTLMSLFQASFTPSQTGKGSVLDDMFQAGDVPPPVYNYFTDMLQGTAGAFLMPLYMSQDPKAAALLRGIGGQQVLGGAHGLQAAVGLSGDFARDYSDATGLSTTSVGTGFRLFNLLSGKKARGLEIVEGANGGGGRRIPGGPFIDSEGRPTGPPGGPGALVTPGETQVPFNQLTIDQQINRVASALAEGMSPDVLLEAGAPQAVVHRAITMRRHQPQAETQMSIDPTAVKRFGLSTNPNQVMSAVGTAAQSTLPQGILTPTQAFGRERGTTTPTEGGEISEITRTRMAALGVSDPDALFVIDRESKADPTARNPQPVVVGGREEHAFGIGQLIDSNRIKYGRILGIDPDTTDPSEQFRLADAYVNDRYGERARRAGITPWQFARRFWERNRSY